MISIIVYEKPKYRKSCTENANLNNWSVFQDSTTSNFKFNKNLKLFDIKSLFYIEV